MSKSLLDFLSWGTEKLLRRRKGVFDLILVIFEKSNGKLLSLEYACRTAPKSLSDATLLNAVAEEIRTRRGRPCCSRSRVSYLGSRVTKYERLASTETISLRGVALEVHTAAMHIRAFRELIERPDGNVLATMTPAEECFDGPYIRVLNPRAHADFFVLEEAHEIFRRVFLRFS